ncbi:MAG: V-type ATP synthase subunit F [Clostridia bacterium]|nr:V-type ATP synthase subunit F [Clostridia bacterium]NLF21329.1 V-type ATP synthase subunit F [Clostridiaceae bacterium]
MKYEIAVIGDTGSVIAFRGLGFTVVPIEDDTGAEGELYRLIDSKRFAIIYITEPLARRCSKVLSRYSAHATPAIILIPASNDSGGYAMANLKQSVIRAVGFDVLANKKEGGESKNE